MPPRRHTWSELPKAVRSAVERQTGYVHDVAVPEFGVSAEFSATLDTATGLMFCKGIRVDAPTAWAHCNEARVGPWLPANLAPCLLWEVAEAGWLMLGFEHVEGRHPVLSPRSCDLGKVGELVATMTDVLTPCPSAARNVLADRWASAPGWAAVYAKSPADLHPWARAHIGNLETLERSVWLDGDTLVHSDLHPGNMLAQDARLRAVDWAWSARGPAWFDTAYLVLRLMHSGHTPEAAEGWARYMPAFANAPEPVMTAFASKIAGMWEYIARSPRARPHARALADTARAWIAYRLQ